MEQEILQHLQAQYPLPQPSPVWASSATQAIKTDHGLDPQACWDAFMIKLDDRALFTPLSILAEPGTGIPDSTLLPTMCTHIEGPIVLELVHLTDIGLSAFTIEKVRQARARSFYIKLLALGMNGEVVSDDKLLSIRGKLPSYPHKCLKLVLSDGTNELEAIELEPLDLQLGRTAMGVKIQLVDVPIVSGVAYLRPENVKVIGGRVEALELPHLSRLGSELYLRMQKEIVVSKETGVPLPELYAEAKITEN